MLYLHTLPAWKLWMEATSHFFEPRFTLNFNIEISVITRAKSRGKYSGVLAASYKCWKWQGEEKPALSEMMKMCFKASCYLHYRQSD